MTEQPITMTIGDRTLEFPSELEVAFWLLDRMTSDERGKLRSVLATAGNTGPRQKTNRQGDAPMPVRGSVSPTGGI